MKTWTAHLRDDRPPELLREGFSWSAWAFGPLWLAAHRAWVAAGLVLAAQIALVVFARGTTLVVLWITGNWLLGLFGNDLRRWALHLRGYTLAHVVAARDDDSAFTRLLATRPDLADLFLPAGQRK